MRRLRTGDKVGRYVLETQLGQGTSAEVWAAIPSGDGAETPQDVPPAARVALKILRRSLGAKPDRLHLANEASALRRVTSPHVVRALDDGEHDRLPFLVMELLEGKPLDTLPTPMPPTDAIVIARDVADALAAVHHVGLVHADLRPANIMVTPRGAVLFDFTSAQGILTTTQPGDHGPCSLPWAAPERLRKEPFDGRADVYALGHILYSLLAGRHAFEPHLQAEPQLVDDHLTATPARLETTPRAIFDVVELALAKNPQERPDAATVLKLLERACGAAGVPAPAAQSPGAGDDGGDTDGDDTHELPPAPTRRQDVSPPTLRLPTTSAEVAPPDAARASLPPMRFASAYLDSIRRGPSASDPGAAVRDVDGGRARSRLVVPTLATLAVIALGSVLLVRATRREVVEPRPPQLSTATTVSARPSADATAPVPTPTTVPSAAPSSTPSAVRPASSHEAARVPGDKRARTLPASVPPPVPPSPPHAPTAANRLFDVE